MSLGLAVAYRLFAPGEKPRRTLLVRSFYLVVAVVTIGVLLYRTVPTDLFQYLALSQHHRLLFVALMTTSLLSLLFMLTHYQYSTVLTRLRVVRLLSVTEHRMKMLYASAFVPLAIAGYVWLSIVSWRLVGNAVPAYWFWSVCTVSFTVVFLLHTGLRIMGGGRLRAAQPLAAATTILPLLILQDMFRMLPQVSGASSIAGIAFFCVIVGCAVSVISGSIRGSGEQATHLRLPYTHLNLSLLVAARALRSRRFLHAHLLIVVIVASLCLSSYTWPHVLDFNLAAAAAILVVGTSAQEVRSLSAYRYPIELVFYGKVRQWVGSLWIGNGMAGGLFILGVLIAAVMPSAGTLDISLARLGCITVMLLTIGACLSSLIVPRQKDIGSQFANSFVYIIASWVVFKYVGGMRVTDTLLVCCTLGIVLAGFGLSYGLEKARWIKTIKGSYGNIF